MENERARQVDNVCALLEVLSLEEKKKEIMYTLIALKK